MGVKISQLPPAVAIGGSDTVPINQGGVTRQVPFSDFVGASQGDFSEALSAVQQSAADAAQAAAAASAAAASKPSIGTTPGTARDAALAIAAETAATQALAALPAPANIFTVAPPALGGSKYAASKALLLASIADASPMLVMDRTAIGMDTLHQAVHMVRPEWFATATMPFYGNGAVDPATRTASGTADDACIQAAIAAVTTVGGPFFGRHIVIAQPSFLAHPELIVVPKGVHLRFEGAGMWCWHFGTIQGLTLYTPGRGLTQQVTLSVPGVTIAYSPYSLSIVNGGSGISDGDTGVCSVTGNNGVGSSFKLTANVIANGPLAGQLTLQLSSAQSGSITTFPTGPNHDGVLTVAMGAAGNPVTFTEDYTIRNLTLTNPGSGTFYAQPDPPPVTVGNVSATGQTGRATLPPEVFAVGCRPTINGTIDAPPDRQIFGGYAAINGQTDVFAAWFGAKPDATPGNTPGCTIVGAYTDNRGPFQAAFDSAQQVRLAYGGGCYGVNGMVYNRPFASLLGTLRGSSMNGYSIINGTSIVGTYVGASPLVGVFRGPLYTYNSGIEYKHVTVLTTNTSAYLWCICIAGLADSFQHFLNVQNFSTSQANLAGGAVASWNERNDQNDKRNWLFLAAWENCWSFCHFVANYGGRPFLYGNTDSSILNMYAGGGPNLIAGPGLTVARYMSDNWVGTTAPPATIVSVPQGAPPAGTTKAEAGTEISPQFSGNDSVCFTGIENQKCGQIGFLVTNGNLPVGSSVDVTIDGYISSNMNTAVADIVVRDCVDVKISAQHGGRSPTSIALQGAADYVTYVGNGVAGINRGPNGAPNSVFHTETGSLYGAVTINGSAGQVVVGNTATAGALAIDGAANQARLQSWRIAGTTRFDLGILGAVQLAAPIATTGDTGGISSTALNVASVSGLAAGMTATGTGIPSGTFIATGGVGASSVTLTAAATVASGTAITFLPNTGQQFALRGYDDAGTLKGTLASANVQTMTWTLTNVSVSGTATGTTMATGDRSTSFATTAFVGNALTPYLTKADNLASVLNASTAWANLGGGALGKLAIPAAGYVSSTGTALSSSTAAQLAAALIGTTTGTVADGGALAAETTRATQAEALKAPLASPALTGTPTAPTASAGTGGTQIATNAYADAAVAAEALLRRMQFPGFVPEGWRTSAWYPPCNGTTPGAATLGTVLRPYASLVYLPAGAVIKKLGVSLTAASPATAAIVRAMLWSYQPASGSTLQQPGAVLIDVQISVPASSAVGSYPATVNYTVPTAGWYWQVVASDTALSLASVLITAPGFQGVLLGGNGAAGVLGSGTTGLYGTTLASIGAAFTSWTGSTLTTGQATPVFAFGT